MMMRRFNRVVSIDSEGYVLGSPRVASTPRNYRDEAAEKYRAYLADVADRAFAAHIGLTLPPVPKG